VRQCTSTSNGSTIDERNLSPSRWRGSSKFLAQLSKLEPKIWSRSLKLSTYLKVLSRSEVHGSDGSICGELHFPYLPHFRYISLRSIFQTHQMPPLTQHCIYHLPLSSSVSRLPQGVEFLLEWTKIFSPNLINRIISVTQEMCFLGGENRIL
jgi:hypothetical protein